MVGVRVTDAALTQAQARARHELAILDTPREDRFARAVRLARRLFDVPVVAVSLISDDGRWYTASAGMELQEGSGGEAFCQATLDADDALVVPDTRVDARFRMNPLVNGRSRVGFYAGQPLTGAGGHRLGVLSLLDTRPRRFSYADIDILRDLADWVQKELASDEELERAFEVQRRLLPRAAPTVPGYEIAGRCVPARDVAGDFFDYFLVGDEVQLSIADVMGKGVAAAIIAASVRAVLRGATRFIGLAEAVNRVATDLAPDLADTATFVTLFSARLHPASGRLTYVDAGHGLSGIISPGGRIRQLESDDPPLGVFESGACGEHVTTLGVGETFVAVSDGLLDYFASPGSAAVAVARSAREATGAHDLIDRISNYSMGHLVMDDLTTIVIRRTG
jgi:hypothetical protein